MPPVFSKELKRPDILPNYLACQLRNSPCESYCPAGNPVQRITGLIKDNRFEEALQYIRSKNPFPGVCGRICPHPCESKCNRNDFDEGLSIKNLERAAADYSGSSAIHRSQPAENTGKNAAVIGAGPAGLTGAYFLRLLGHGVTIFEASSFLGGMLRSSIPDFRLPKEIVEIEIDYILELGVKTKTNTTVGKDVSLNEIIRQFDACLLSTGSWKEKTLNIKGIEQAVPGLSFLRKVKGGQITSVGKKVAIIGGGGVAFDCAFTALRLGASEAHIFCLEPSDKMIATQEDISRAIEEGIVIHNSIAVNDILSAEGKVIRLEFQGVESFRFDEYGKLSLTLDKRRTDSLEVDTVISAIGQSPDFSYLAGDDKFKFTPAGALLVNPDSRSTSVEGVFAAGDAIYGASGVANSIGSGRQAALSIHHYLTRGLNSKSLEEESHIKTQHVVLYDELLHIDYFQNKPRLYPSKTHKNNPTGLWEVQNPGYSREQAVEEAGRCFHCGQCFSCGSCVEDCPGYVLSMGNHGPEITYPDECWHCGNCRISCPCGAVQYEFPLSMLV